MGRGERRRLSDKVAKRRFEEAKAIAWWWNDGRTEGHYRKKNPFTFPKVPKRGWQKKQNEKQARLKDAKRNGIDGGTGGMVDVLGCDPSVR